MEDSTTYTVLMNFGAGKLVLKSFFLLTMPCGFTEFKRQGLKTLIVFLGFVEIYILFASAAGPGAMPQVIWVGVDSMLPLNE